ncbi:tail protein X [Sphingomonas sp. Leaf38]|jgi:phage tail protein X|uniref:tail protein X n=1 Tax=Sphingomonas sp. Leaf38 TaxID=1736217 RepID=UPI0006FA71CA|nr:tail protein X [Sphingomonas sp. Leaf38]KQN29715.1 phage tail protein [Sphingomonas sp. Leaf38]
MADVIRSQQGDTLDALIWRERGLAAANLAPVLTANPGLAGLGAVLPAGTAVTVPATAPAVTVRDIIQLWSD